MSDVAHCPFCDLRFAATWELKLHLDGDHPGRIVDKDAGEVVIEDGDPHDPDPL